MKIKLLLFASLQERFRTSQMDLDILPEMPVSSVLECLFDNGIEAGMWGRFLMYAVNHQHVKSDHVLREGDEVALIPPMAGG